MSGGNRRPRAVPLSDLRALLCDADDTLFPSEDLAFEVSAEVMNAFLGSLGVDRCYTPTELRLTATGSTFRTTALTLAARHGADGLHTVERWVEREKSVVEAHLRASLRPDYHVIASLTALQEHLVLAAVSSSASSRLDACFTATELADLIPAQRRFSAEDSLPVPTSKPDPAIYQHACEQLGVPPENALAVEDSAPGVRSAVAAGCPTVGTVVFVRDTERPARVSALRDAGAVAVVGSWPELTEWLSRESATSATIVESG